MVKGNSFTTTHVAKYNTSVANLPPAARGANQGE